MLLNRQGLISWPRYLGHAVIGIGAAVLAYQYLILPNRSLVPNLDTAGNEIWLAILAFLYAVANKVPLAGGPGTRRRNAFVRTQYRDARQAFGELIDKKITDDLLRLVAYSILVYEGYCRPPAVRRLERLLWWKPKRTTGVMQVAADRSLSDLERVQRGTSLLLGSWTAHAKDGGSRWDRLRSTIADYNKDDGYIDRVYEVMEILAKQVAAPKFEQAFDNIWSD